jgi:serine/threonine protein phosphatase PrpC
LFDGHAGGRCSKYISSTLPDVLTEDSLFLTNLPLALKRSFHTANDVFLKVAEQQKLHDGSTGICSLMRNGKLLVGNVGDCRALLLSAGKPIQMSIDQKPTNVDEIKRIASLGGTITNNLGVARVNGVLAVSRAFGNRKLRKVIRPDIEMMQRELTREDDFLVMASDGLWDVLRNKDVCDLCYSMANTHRCQQISEELVHNALARGSMDNVTCIVVKLGGYIAKTLCRENGDNRLENGSSNYSGSYADRTRSRSPGKQRVINISPAQSPLTLDENAIGGTTQMQRSLFSRSNGQNLRPDSPENFRYASSFNTAHNNSANGQRPTNTVNNTINNTTSNTQTYASKLLNGAPAIVGNRFEVPISGVTSSSSRRSPGGGPSYNSNKETRSPPAGLWSATGSDVTNNSLFRHGTEIGLAQNTVLQGRLSPSPQSVPALNDRNQPQYMQNHNITNQTQHYQVVGNSGNIKGSREDGSTFGNDKADSDIDDPVTVLMRPNPQLAIGQNRNQSMTTLNRFQQGQKVQGVSLLSMPNHDSRSGFSPPLEQSFGRKNNLSNRGLNMRASSASAASVRHSQNISTIPRAFSDNHNTKTFSPDTLHSLVQSDKIIGRSTESPVLSKQNSFASIAASNGANNTSGSIVNGGMRPLNSPIAFLTAAAEKQRSASTQRGAQVQAVRPVSTGISANTDRHRIGASTTNKKQQQMRIAYT